MRKFFRSHWIMEEVMRLTIFIALVCFLFGMGSHYVDWNNLPQINNKVLCCFIFAILTWVFFGCGILSIYHVGKKPTQAAPFEILAIGCIISAIAFAITFSCCLRMVVKDILY